MITVVPALKIQFDVTIGLIRFCYTSIIKPFSDFRKTENKIFATSCCIFIPFLYILNNNIDFICLYLEASKRQQIQGLQRSGKDKKKKRHRQKYRKRQTKRREERETGNGR